MSNKNVLSPKNAQKARPQGEHVEEEILTEKAVISSTNVREALFADGSSCFTRTISFDSIISDLSSSLTVFLI